MTLNGVTTADARYLCRSWVSCYMCHIPANACSQCTNH